MSETRWPQLPSGNSVCKTHMQLVSAFNASLHPQQICSVTSDVKSIEQEFNLSDSDLEEGLKRIREERKRNSSVHCLVCGESATGLKIETMKTYCEKCYPGSIKNAVDISAMIEEDLRRTIDIAIRVYSREVQLSLREDQIAYINSQAPVATILNYLQQVVLGAELNNPDRLLSCTICSNEHPLKSIVRTIRMPDHSIHYCHNCFLTSNIGSRYSNVLSISYFEESVRSPFHTPYRVNFSEEVEDSCGDKQDSRFWWECQVQSSHPVRLSALLLGGFEAGWNVAAIHEIKLNNTAVNFYDTVDRGARQARLLAEQYLPAGKLLQIAVNLTAHGSDSIVFRTDVAHPYYLGNDGSLWQCKPEKFENCGLVAIEYYCRKAGI